MSLILTNISSFSVKYFLLTNILRPDKWHNGVEIVANKSCIWLAVEGLFKILVILLWWICLPKWYGELQLFCHFQQKYFFFVCFEELQIPVWALDVFITDLSVFVGLINVLGTDFLQIHLYHVTAATLVICQTFHWCNQNNQMHWNAAH